MVLCLSCLIGLAVMSLFWSRVGHLREQEQLAGRSSLLVQEVQSFLEASQGAVRLIDLGMIALASAGEGQASDRIAQGFIAQEARAQLEALEARLPSLRESPLATPEYLELLESTEQGIEALQRYAADFLTGGTDLTDTESLDELVHGVGQSTTRLQQLLDETSLKAAARAARLEANLRWGALLAAGAYVALVLLAWRWVSGRALNPLQDLTEAAREHRVTGKGMQLEPAGPTEVRDLICSVSELVQGLAQAREQLEERVRRDSAHLDRAKVELEHAELKLVQSQKLEAVGRPARRVRPFRFVMRG